MWISLTKAAEKLGMSRDAAKEYAEKNGIQMRKRGRGYQISEGIFSCEKKSIADPKEKAMISLLQKNISELTNRLVEMQVRARKAEEAVLDLKKVAAFSASNKLVQLENTALREENLRLKKQVLFLQKRFDFALPAPKPALRKEVAAFAATFSCRW